MTTQTQTTTAPPTPAGSDPGAAAYRLVERLYAIPRSITGDGLRRTLQVIAEHIPLTIHCVPSGTAALDWTVPSEWNVREAYIADSRGRRIVDYRDCFLHLMSYSSPVRAKMSLAKLRPHLHSLPDRPDWVPFRATYYAPNWGFCLSERQLQTLREDEYTVVIDSTLAAGELNYGECFIPGRSEQEVVISAHACHPGMCNDNLSGVSAAVELAKGLAGTQPRLSYRFLFIPGGIGSVVWLSRNEQRLGRIRHGLVLSCVGDAGGFTYKRSRRGDAEIDHACRHVLRCSGQSHRIIDFSPYGYDERNFCSPGFDLPVGCFSRSRNGEYPQYHTSADDLSLVRPECLGESIGLCREVLGVLEGNASFVNVNPKGEVQLGKRGLYGPLGGLSSRGEAEMAMLWVLNFSDGRHSLLEIAERSEMRFAAVRAAADALLKAGLLKQESPRCVELWTAALAGTKPSNCAEPEGPRHSTRQGDRQFALTKDTA